MYKTITGAYRNTSDNKSFSKELSDPAHRSYATALSMFEKYNPLRSNQGTLFEPANPFSGPGIDNLNEQVLSLQRKKRDSAGALEILTNHALPIHADVKYDGTAVTEKVTPPEDTFYELKSLRKSWPLPNKLELVRSISRVITLAVLLITAVVEFFPLLKSLYSTAYSFMYM